MVVTNTNEVLNKPKLTAGLPLSITDPAPTHKGAPTSGENREKGGGPLCTSWKMDGQMVRWEDGSNGKLLSRQQGLYVRTQNIRNTR